MTSVGGVQPAPHQTSEVEAHLLTLLLQLYPAARAAPVLHHLPCVDQPVALDRPESPPSPSAAEHAVTLVTESGFPLRCRTAPSALPTERFDTAPCLTSSHRSGHAVSSVSYTQPTQHITSGVAPSSNVPTLSLGESVAIVGVTAPLVPEPPAAVDTAWRERLIAFYEFWSPRRLPLVASQLRQYRGQENALLRTLELQLGLEPTADELRMRRIPLPHAAERWPLPHGWARVVTPRGDVLYKNADGRRQWARPKADSESAMLRHGGVARPEDLL